MSDELYFRRQPSGFQNECCCSTRVRWRMVNRTRGRCLMARAKMSSALARLLPA